MIIVISYKTGLAEHGVEIAKVSQIHVGEAERFGIGFKISIIILMVGGVDDVFLFSRVFTCSPQAFRRKHEPPPRACFAAIGQPEVGYSVVQF